MPLQIGAAAELTPEELAELKEMFDLLDRDKGGTLSIHEVSELMRLLGMPASLDEVVAMVRGVDADGGALDFEQFLEIVAAPQPLPFSQADLLRAFRRFADRGAPGGCIAPETLERALLAHGAEAGIEPAEVARLVHSLDTTPDGGYVDYREVSALLFAGQRRRGGASGNGVGAGVGAGGGNGGLGGG